MTKIILSIVLCSINFSILTGQQAQFDIQTSGTNPAIDSTIQYATELWSPFLISNIPIKINFSFISLGGGGTLGITIPNGRKDFIGAPISETWYPTCLANSIANMELNAGEVDMDIVMNTDVNWYFGTDGNPPANQYDFVSVFMHEVGHGLGILSLSKVENGEGSFGEITSSDFLGFSSFPFPMLDGKPAIFDHFVVNDSQQSLIDTSLFPQNSSALATELTSNQIFYSGQHGVMANDTIQPKLYAPNAFALGSSILHLDENTFPSSDSNGLMTPFSSLGEVNHHPGPVILGVLKDIGWPESVFPVGISEHTSNEPIMDVSVIQNFEEIRFLYTLESTEIVSFHLFEISGKNLFSTNTLYQFPGSQSISLNHSEIGPSIPAFGYYIYSLKIGDAIHTGKVLLRGS